MEIVPILTAVLGSILVGLVGYLLGSINSAIIITRLWSSQDIRALGSGNAGMTNVLRTQGKIPAVLTIVGDLSKGIIAVLLARLVFSWFSITYMDGAYIAGMFALLGHLFPVYFGFKGGKGVLVSAAVILVINPWVLLILFAVFVLVVAISRFVSLGSIACAVLYPLVTLAVLLFQGRPALGGTIFALLMSIIVFYMHRGNIRRLLDGTESRLGSKKSKE